MTAPIFRFVGRATGCDPHGYYHPRWGQARNISVLAGTKGEARDKAFAMLGVHPRFGVKGFGDARDTPGWTLVWDRIDEEANA